MLSFVQNWLAPRVNPIGVDFGTDCLRLAQVQLAGDEYRLIAAASCDVPSHARTSAQARIAFFIEAVRDLMAQGNFQSRQAVLGLPASMMYIQHLRLAKMDDEQTKKAIPWEARGKLPIDPSQALIRHLIAGEVYQEQEPRNEVIVMAAQRDLVTQFLGAAARAKLDVVGMNVEPKALIDCFDHVYRRTHDSDLTTCFLDIGSCASRAVIARGTHVFFARTIAIGGDHFTKAAALALRVSIEEAKLLRIKLCQAQPAPAQQASPPAQPAAATAQPVSAPEENSFALLGAGLQQAQRSAQQPPAAAPTSAPDEIEAPASVAPQNSTARTDQAGIVEQACRELLAKLVQELDLCRRYYESTFPSRPVDRLVFVGGEARNRALCQQIARELGLAAQLGDPLVRMAKISDIGMESGIDRRQPQPGWAVAIGLSMGPATAQQQQSQSAPRAAVAAQAT